MSKTQYELSLKDLVTAGLQKMDAAVNKFEANLKQTQSQLKGLGSGLNTTNLLIGLSYVQQAATAIIGFGTQAVRAYDEAEQASAQLNATLASTNNIARLSRKALDEQAKALMKLTVFDDDAITSSQSLLATFTNIRGELFYKTIPAITDLATKLGTDLNGATLQVGKALNDPVQGVTALRRAGVSFSAEQLTMIKNFQETNQLAKAQQIVLEELNKEFGGSAMAAAQAGLGPLKQFQNEMGNLMEQLGGGIIEVSKQFLSGFDFSGMLGKDPFSFLSEGLAGIIDKVGPAVKSIGEYLGPIFNQLFNVYARLAPVIDKFVSTVLQSPVIQKIGGLITQVGLFLVEMQGGVMTTLLNLFTNIFDIVNTIYVALEKLGIIWVIQKAFQGVGLALQGIGNVLKTIYEYTLKPIFDAIGFAYEGIKGILGITSTKGLLGNNNRSATERGALEMIRPTSVGGFITESSTQASAQTKQPKVQSNKAITINVSIENLVKTFQVYAGSLTSSRSEIKEKVAFALVDAMNDFQIIADR